MNFYRDVVADDPATTVLGWELGRELMAALRQLSPEHRAVIDLTFGEGFSYPQTASIVGCPENTVKTRMFHTRRRLAQLLSHLELEGAEAYASLGGTSASCFGVIEPFVSNRGITSRRTRTSSNQGCIALPLHPIRSDEIASDNYQLSF